MGHRNILEVHSTHIFPKTRKLFLLWTERCACARFQGKWVFLLHILKAFAQFSCSLHAWVMRSFVKLNKPRVRKNKFDVHVTVHRVKFLIIKPTRCSSFSNLFLEWNSTFFGQFLCPSSGVFHCTHSNGICHRGLLTACSQQTCQDGTSWSCLQAVS